MTGLLKVSFVLGLALIAADARAHISIVSGAGFADATQEVTFGVGHGCAGVDTYRVRIEIPEEVTSVRTETSDFGAVTLEKNEAGLITAVVWQKPDDDVLEGDTAYYKLTLRIKVPNQPFTTLYFPAHQTCRTPGGVESSVDWIATPPIGENEEPAPSLTIVPQRAAGWNRLQVGAAITDLATYFKDAIIVWKGSAAFSMNALTTELIAATTGVTALSALAAGDEIWVKY